MRCRPTDATKKVDPMSHQLKVGRIDAGGIAAQVIPILAWLTRRSAYKEMVSEDRTSPFFAKVEHPVAISVERTNPDHAAVGPAWIYVAPEANSGVKSATIVGHRVISGVIGRSVSETLPPFYFTSPERVKP